MFKHISLSSGSHGNAHLISQDDGESFVLLDCGLGKSKLLKKLSTARVDFDRVKGLIVSHEHGDHLKGANYLKDLMPVYASEGTFEYMEDRYNLRVLKSGKIYKINGMKVMPFNVKHDAREPFGFIIQSKYNEFMVYLTDTGEVNFNFKNIRPTYVLIEANFDEKDFENIDEGNTNDYMKIHMARNLMLDTGHLSIQKTLKVLKSLSLSICKKITLCHVSTKNGKDDFGKRIEKETNIETIQLRPHKVKVIDINKMEDPF